MNNDNLEKKMKKEIQKNGIRYATIVYIFLVISMCVIVGIIYFQDNKLSITPFYVVLALALVYVIGLTLILAGVPFKEVLKLKKQMDEYEFQRFLSEYYEAKVYNNISFVGGYLVIKNIFSYRIVAIDEITALEVKKKKTETKLKGVEITATYMFLIYSGKKCITIDRQEQTAYSYNNIIQKLMDINKNIIIKSPDSRKPSLIMNVLTIIVIVVVVSLMVGIFYYFS